MLTLEDHNTDFLVWCTTGPSLTHGAWTDIVHNVVSHDLHGDYNTSTGLFTCTSPGYYTCRWNLLSASTSWADGEVFQSALSLNDSESSPSSSIVIGYRCEMSAAYTGYGFSRGSITFHLDEGDNLRVKAWHNQGAAINLSSSGYYNCFSIKKVAPEC
jgi:hypothetical protein